MKRVILTLLCALSLPAAVLAASDSATMDVSLNNIASMSVFTTPVDFGDVGTAVGNAYATGTITVNTTNGLPYDIAIDGGLNPVQGEMCRRMTGDATRVYEFMQDGGIPWGDSDYANTCISGSSKAATGNGSDQIHNVYATTGDGPSIGSMSDTVTVTVYY